MPGHVNQGGVTIYAPSAPPGGGAGGCIELQDAYECGNEISVSAAQGGPVTISGDSATVGMKFTSTVKQDAIHIYNTVSETDYERLAIRWASNEARLIVENAGGGSQRNLALYSVGGGFGIQLFGTSGSATMVLVGSSGNRWAFQANSSTVGIDYQSKITTSTTVEAHRFINTNSFSAASGTQTCTSIQMTLGQSGTAAYRVLHILSTETATGSGAHRLIHAETAAAEYFAINTVLGNDQTTIESRVDRAGAETFERLLVGAAGTGGVGFRAIVIPN